MVLDEGDVRVVVVTSCLVDDEPGVDSRGRELCGAESSRIPVLS